MNKDQRSIEEHQSAKRRFTWILPVKKLVEMLLWLGYQAPRTADRFASKKKKKQTTTS